MKKIALILTLVATLTACSLDNDQPNFHSEVIPVASYVVPEKFVLNKEYEIKLKYKQPTDCYSFTGIYYGKELNIRTIGIQTKVLDQANCKPLDNEPLETTFKFTATQEGSYVFKFYKGNDADGKNTFAEVTIPVIKE
jgi:hypothetical protein